MAKNNPGRRQAWRRKKIDQDKQERTETKLQRAEVLAQTSDLGPPQSGRVIAHFGANFTVQDTPGDYYYCLSRRNLPKLVCGDYVTWQATGQHEGVIVELKPRATFLSRPDYQNQLKPIASNIDQILVVIATQPPFDVDLINRYLIAAELTNIVPVIVLNKIDLISQHLFPEVTQQLNIYRHIGYRLIFATKVKKHGLKELRECVEAKTSIFVGQSGVGKSSLIKSLIPDADIKVGELSHATGLGKHTTTVSTLFQIDTGGAIIDSPGIREFGLGHVSQPRVAEGFVEFGEYIKECKFNDCSHRHEPHCAVIEAVQRGDICQQRYQSYLRIVDSLSKR